MSVIFPLVIKTMGPPPPFAIIPNVNFPDVEPVCVLTNLGPGPGPVLDTFIVTYPGPKPPGAPPPNAWEIQFRWETAGPASAGIWILDAWLESLSEGPNIHVPAAPLPLAILGGSPTAYAPIIGVPADAVIPPLPIPGAPGEPLTARLYRLHTSLRWAEVPPLFTRVVGHGVGPIIEFYTPLP